MDGLKKRYNSISIDFSSCRKKPWEEMQIFTDLLKKGDRVLDVGCGNGRFYESINSVAEYVGIDLSEKLIQIAKKKHPDGNFLIADILSAPFSSASFDKVYAIAVFHHIPSERLRQRFLEEIRRILKPGGMLILTVWDIWEKPKRRREVIRQGFLSFLGMSKLDVGDVILDWLGSDFYFHCFNLYGLKRRIKKAGFRIIKSGDAPSEGGRNLFVVATTDN